MNKQIPSYLRLVTDTITEPPAAPPEDFAGMAAACRAFEQATLWRLEYSAEPNSSEKQNLMWSAPVNPGVGTSPGHIRLFSTEHERSGAAPRVALADASRLAEALGQMWGEVLAARRSLREREAELATGVPLVVRGDDAESPALVERLEAVLRGGAQAIDCQAAALYLLDPATSELKLRSAWGLPHNRLAAPARPLRGALADLEALLGHAVVLADRELHPYWKVPEHHFASCVCVPVSSPTMPLGTLWAFCRDARDFTPTQTNILEMAAGRLAADLERQVLIDEARSTRTQSQQIVAAERWQQEQLPRIAPVVEGWEIAAKAYHAGPLGSTFYDWFALDDGAVAIVAGNATEPGVGGALTAAALRAAARTLGPARRGCHVLLEKANSILWTGSAGNASAGLFQAMIDPQAESFAYCAAGPLRLVALDEGNHLTALSTTPPLGLQEEVLLSEARHKLRPGGLLMAYAAGNLAQLDDKLISALEKRLAAALVPVRSLPASKLVEIASEILRSTVVLANQDQMLVLIKRRRR